MALKTIEINHPMVKPLLETSDPELLDLFQTHPESGKYLVAIFCRYGQIVYALTHESGRSPVQADDLFAKTWERIYQELKSLPRENLISLQNFLIDITGVAINSYVSPPNIKYDLSVTPPIFLCYLIPALEKLPKDLRLVLALSFNFNWGINRIAAYLQADGSSLPKLFRHYQVKDMEGLIAKANLVLMQFLPEDIQEIYLAIKI